MNDKDIIDRQRDRHQLMKSQDFEVLGMMNSAFAGFIMGFIGFLFMIISLIKPGIDTIIGTIVCVSSSAVLLWYAFHIKKRLEYEARRTKTHDARTKSGIQKNQSPS